jgi:hypothetical protein
LMSCNLRADSLPRAGALPAISQRCSIRHMRWTNTQQLEGQAGGHHCALTSPRAPRCERREAAERRMRRRGKSVRVRRNKHAAARQCADTRRAALLRRGRDEAHCDRGWVAVCHLRRGPLCLLSGAAARGDSAQAQQQAQTANKHAPKSAHSMCYEFQSVPVSAVTYFEHTLPYECHERRQQACG